MNAVEVQALSKRYRLGGVREAHYKTIRDSLAGLARFRRRAKPAKNEVWALRDVSFEVAEGEALGIIGRNGAGKSTLLKILSRITEPTSGTARLRGRVASLLEVGTGFHPELTGRENIFLNGSILGMSRAEILRDFDAIVAFAEIEKFLDTPVKRYSSGMYVRLAFAVAAHLTPEILIVDEVLAVGDAEFQKRCLGRMGEVARSGRTVLFVSHNLRSIEGLCPRAIWLDLGEVQESGPSSAVVSKYLRGNATETLRWVPRDEAGKIFRYRSVHVEDDSGKPVVGELPANEPFDIVMRYEISESLPAGRLAIRITDESGTTILVSANTDGAPFRDQSWEVGEVESRCRIPGHWLAPGSYTLAISEPLDNGKELIRESVLKFEIGVDRSLKSRDSRPGVLAPLLSWKTETREPARR